MDSIYNSIDKDFENGVNNRVQTCFVFEPDGYLNISHAKAVCINFETAKNYNGFCNLRIDDTKFSIESNKYVDAAMDDIKWLGYSWDNVLYTSSYFDFIYECAIKLIKNGKAYVCDLYADEIREYRGTLTEPGKNSPYRDRSVEENLDLFARMTAGEFADGEKTLRAKIDMASPNINMRDPVIYRISRNSNHQTHNKKFVCPTYDFVRSISDAREGVTYSLCSLEFENHRPLYDWFVKEIGFEEPPRQIEFARLNLNYSITAKSKCLDMVQKGIVDGWDDPRMITLCGMRRRGYPAAAIREFINRIGISKADSVVDYGLLEACVKDNLNENAPRAMAVLHPLKVVIDNYPEGQSEEIEVEINHLKPELGKRTVHFSREIFVERDDFMVEPPTKYFRLFPGNEVRLKSAYLVTCNSWEADENGEITCLHCTYDPETKGGDAHDGRKVKGTIHWVNASDSTPCEIRLYGRLFIVENPTAVDGKGNYLNHLNPNSLEILENCLVEGGIGNAKCGDTFMFIRQGYFCVDKNSTDEKLIFNRTVDLKSSWK